MREEDLDPELTKALEPVRQHFSSREITVNTVLAAYVRSVGLPVYGESWETAKQAIQDGYSFPQAARIAAMSSARPTAASRAASTFQSRRTLSWYPKQFSPGDIDGVGAKRLLGTPNIDPAWLLVRETAQNSWDARGVSPNVDFTLNLRMLDLATLNILRNRVFTGDSPGTGLTQLLQREAVWALEVSDRGTVGLGGPIRNDLAMEPGIDRNFIDLVFNIGAPRDVHLGGGTYGFGKTITYLLSSVGTVLIWSRCEGASGKEDRLIGSAIGDAFNMNSARYTGRHWWGNVITTENRVEPVVGSLAREIGDAIFTNRFSSDDTGTSILILDPQLEGDSPEKAAQRLADAATWNLWPKLLADQNGRSQMNIDIQLNGRSLELPDVHQHPILNGYAACLLAIRAAESKTTQENSRYPYTVDCREIRHGQSRTLLGHLALTRYLAPPEIDNPAHSVVLMRQAELVVKYLDRRQLDVEGFQWAGVFKSATEVDDSFALAEPPAHDDWIPQAIENRQRRSQVNVALRRIRETTDEYLAPGNNGYSTEQEGAPSTVHVADMLADLLSGQEGPAPTRVVLQGSRGLGTDLTPTPDDRNSSTAPSFDKAKAKAGSKPGKADRSRKRGITYPKAEIIGIFRVSARRPGWNRTMIQVQLSGTSPPGATVDVVVSVGFEGGRMEDEEAVHIVGWRDESSGAYDPLPQAFESGTTRQFVYESRSDLAIDIETRLGDGLWLACACTHTEWLMSTACLGVAGGSSAMVAVQNFPPRSQTGTTPARKL